MLTFDRPLIMKGKRRLVKSAMFRKISIVIPEALRKAIRSSTALSAVSCPEVPGRIHCNDEMLASFSDEHIREYMMAGFSALSNIEDSLTEVGRSFSDIKSCLDIPCGYGRVLRWLCIRMDASRITACDLNKEGVDFCEREFRTNPLYSDQNVRDIVLPDKYDLIWVGSLLTHLDAESGPALLHLLTEALSPSGTIVFTTHGESCLQSPGIRFFYLGMPIAKGREALADLEARLVQQFAFERFCYAPYEHAGNYGVTIHHRSYVEELMEKHFSRQLRQIRFRERGWDELQDVWTYQRC
jgi:SAM-dependent methyltransferase